MSKWRVIVTGCRRSDACPTGHETWINECCSPAEILKLRRQRNKMRDTLVMLEGVLYDDPATRHIYDAHREEMLESKNCEGTL